MSCPLSRGVVACALAALFALPAHADGLLALDRVFADVGAANPSLVASRHEAGGARARARRAGAWVPRMLGRAAANLHGGGGLGRGPLPGRRARAPRAARRAARPRDRRRARASRRAARMAGARLGLGLA